MRKTIAAAAGALSTLLFSTSVFAIAKTAVSICPENSQFNKLCETSAEKLPNYIGSVLSIILAVAVLIAVFFLIWGGIKWILSGGDKSAVESARNHIVAAIIGLIIALLAFFIVQIVGRLFGIDLLHFDLPSII